MNPKFAKDYFAAKHHEILDSWFELLAITSIGANPQRLGDCSRAAAWLKRFLKPLCFNVEIILPKSDLPVPVLFAERQGHPSVGTSVLFYGHYDVQPEDPLEEWHTLPFQPTLIRERVYARGAQDNKGQLFAFLQGLKALIEAGEKLPTIKVLLEGQEESGSTGLTQLAPTIRQRLKADVLMVCDTTCTNDNQPVIITGMRGIQHLTLTLTGPNHDLHSGVHGGAAPNPAQGMAKLLASLHSPDGAIAVPNFCDHISEPTPAELQLAMASALSPAAYANEIGCEPAGGQKDLDHTTRISFRPTIEINGIHSGYGGPGSKTVIPACAEAKLSMRLVPDQQPAETMNAIKKHLEANLPRGMSLTFSDLHVGTPGMRLPLNSPIFRLAKDVLKQMDARGALFRWSGASIPIVALLQQLSGGAPLLVGFGREEDKIHSPNESFGLDQFERVMIWTTLMLKALCE